MTANETHPRKRYLVTGAAGFIGSRFVQSCCPNPTNPFSNISIISVDQVALFDTRKEHGGIDFGHRLDLSIFMKWLTAFKNGSPLGQHLESMDSLTAIIHLGACSDTLEKNLDFLWRWNVEFSQSLWNFAASAKVPFLYASSAATYGDGSLGYNDDEQLCQRLQPLNPYGSSKAAFDRWVLEEERRGNRPPLWAGLKFFNVYGFGEGHKKHASSKIYHAFHEITQTGKIKLFKSHHPSYQDGEQKRDFMKIGG